MSDTVVVPGPTFTVALPTLVEGLAAFGTLNLSRPPVPVLGGLRIDSGPDGTVLSAFDYETSVRVHLDAGHTDTPQSVLVSFDELQKLLKAAVKGETKKTWSGWDVQFRSQISSGTRVRTQHTLHNGVRSETKMVEPWQAVEATLVVAGFELPVTDLPIEDYPHLPETGPAQVVVDRDVLAGLHAKVAVAAGTDDTLPMLTGQRWELRSGTLTLASTNRFQLAVANTKVDQVGADISGLLPSTTLGKLLKVLPAGEVSVGFPETGGWATIRGGHITATVRLMDAEFPRFRHLLPTESTSTVVVDRAALHKLAAKADAIAATLGRAGSVHVRVGDGAVTLVPQAGENQQRVKGASMAAQTTGGVVTFAVSPTYLLDALASFDTAQVAVSLTSPARPVLLAETVEALLDQHASYRHLVMPQQIPG